MYKSAAKKMARYSTSALYRNHSQRKVAGLEPKGSTGWQVIIDSKGLRKVVRVAK